MTKAGDKLIHLCNMMELEKMAQKREELGKKYRLELWLAWNKKEDKND